MKINLFLALIFINYFDLNESAACSSLMGAVGNCMNVSNCTGGTFFSTLCSNSEICCVDDPKINQYPSYTPSKYPGFTRQKFLKLTGDTARNRALFAWFAKAMDDSNINTCHLAAVFFAQLASETKMFTEFESRELENDLDSNLGNNMTGDGYKYKGRGAILIRGKTNYNNANIKIKNIDLINFPENVSLPSVAFPLASWFWNENAYVIESNNPALKKSLNTLADGTFHNFTMLTYSLTNSLQALKERAEYYETAVQELGCRAIKRGRGISCELGEEIGYAVPICLIDHKRSFCGCEGTFSRSCPYGYNSQDICRNSATIRCCIEKCKEGLDLVLIMDSSGSIGIDNFQKQREFLKKIVLNLEIGVNETRVAIINYGTDVQVVANFLKFNDKNMLLNAISSIKYLSSNTNTAGALAEANNNILQENAGMRPFDKGVSKVVIVLTDGASNVNPAMTIPNANKIKNRGINIISVGIGNKLNQQELEGIASTKDDVYNVNDFDKIGLILEALVKTACQQPVIMEQEQEIQATVKKDSYKYFKYSLSDFNSTRQFSIELENLVGNVRLFSSFTDETPKDSNEYITSSSSTNNNINYLEKSLTELRSLNYYLINSPENATYLYLGIKGVEQENEFKINVLNRTVIVNKSTTNKSQVSTLFLFSLILSFIILN